MARKKTKLITNIICSIIAVILLLGAITLFVGRAQNKVTFFFGNATVWILSHSMEDTIEAESYILVKPVTADEVNIGDVIMFYSDDPSLNGGLNTHRVIDIIGDHSEFVTKGDNNLSADTYTAKADKIVGRYVRNLPVMTALFRFFLSPVGFFVIILIICLMTAAICLPDIIKFYKERHKKPIEDVEANERRLIDMEIERLKEQDSNKNK